VDEHLNRILLSAKKLNVPAPKKETIKTAIKRAAKKTEYALYIRLNIWEGKTGKPAWNIFTHPYLAPQFSSGVFGAQTAVYPFARRNPFSTLVYHKTFQYWENRKALQWARKKGFTDTLFLNTEGFLTEGAISNIFWVLGSTLYTPPVTAGLLPGVIRGYILKNAARWNLEVAETLTRPQRLEEADEAFFTNSGFGILPIGEINGRKINRGKPGPIFLKIRKSLNRYFPPVSAG